MTIFVARDGAHYGEFSELEFREKIFAGEVLPTDDYWWEGAAAWAPVSDYRAPQRTVAIKTAPATPAAPEKSLTPREPKTLTLDGPSALGFLGSAILFLGVFAPVVSAPIMGNMNYFQNVLADGVIVMIAGALAGFATARRKFWHLWIYGGVALACALFTFGRFQYGIRSLTKSMAEDLKDNPFAGLADMAIKSVQIQWGLPLLMIGAVIVLLAAAGGTGKLNIALGARR